MPTFTAPRSRNISIPRTGLNATVVDTKKSDANVMVLRVRTDEPLLNFEPGRSVGLGLFPSAPRYDGLGDPHVAADRLIRRSYSIASHQSVGDGSELELLIALVDSATDNPGRLTPRLFALDRGDRLFVSPKAFGRYTTEGIQQNDNVLLLATGTGEAPHVAIADQLLRSGHRGGIAAVTGVRTRSALAFLARHREWESRFGNYGYHALTTREPENLDERHPDFLGRQYLQSEWISGRLAERLGWQPRPVDTHVFLCGNPAMIGAPRGSLPADPTGMVALLQGEGYEVGQSTPGSVRFERYW